MKSTTLKLILSVSIAAWICSGCGKSESRSATASAAPAPAGSKVIQLTADDTMKFNVTRLEATPGEPLRIVFRNTGKMPKQAMAHNWVLLKPAPESEVNAFAIAAAAAVPTYLPAAKMDQVIAHTKLLGPNESDTLDFKAPESPGTYPFLCSFPGHFAMMKGVLVVQ